MTGRSLPPVRRGSPSRSRVRTTHLPPRAIGGRRAGAGRALALGMLSLLIAAALAGVVSPPPPEAVEVGAARLLLRATAAEPTVEDVQRAAALAAAPPAPGWNPRASGSPPSCPASWPTRASTSAARAWSASLAARRSTTFATRPATSSVSAAHLAFPRARLRRRRDLPRRGAAPGVREGARGGVARATKLYFERQRVRLALAAAPPSAARERAEQELRLLELAAELDALTAGAFTGGAR